ncbi:MAG: Mrp/NBP35 family ATP-binding protein [Conexivisphaerales archaeon]
MLQKDEVLKALSAAVDPDTNSSLLNSGQVKNINIYKDGIQVILAPKNPTPERLEKIKGQVQAQLEKLPDHGIIKIDFTPEVPQISKPSNSSVIKHTIALASGKGGVGKSTVAIYLALSLAQKGYSVGLLDADIYGASAHLMIGPKSSIEVKGRQLIPAKAYGLKIMSMGYFTNTESPVIWRGPLVGKAVRDFIELTEWGELDYLIVDLPPGTGDAPLTLAQSLNLDGIVLVTTPQEAAANVAAKSYYMFKRLGIPVLGVVENMSYYVCSNCGKRTELFGSSGGERTAEKTGLRFLGKLPLVPEVAMAADRGEPVSNEEAGQFVKEFSSFTELLLSLIPEKEVKN